MSPVPANAVADLLKREPAKIVAATGIFFESLVKKYAQQTVSDVLESYRNGVWGDEAGGGSGYPVLRSTNMRGSKADIADVAWREIPSKQAEDCALQTGDILVTKSSGSSDLVGKSVLFVHPGDKRTYLFSNFTLRLRPNTKVIAPAFLAWFLRSPQALGWRYDTQQNAVGLRNLQTKEFLSQHLPTPPLSIQHAVATYLDGLEAGRDSSAELPSELAEQRRIVARIEELSAKIEEACRLQGQSFQEADALLNAASAQAFSQLENVAVRIVDEICEVRGGIQKSSVRSPGANPRRYITVAHVQRNWINAADPRYFEVSDEELERWRLLPGDVLVIEGNGSADQIGRAALFKGEIGDCVHQNHVIRVRPNSTLILPEYLNTYFNSPVGRDKMLERSRTTSGLFNLSVGRIKNIEVPLPPISDQRSIVAHLDDLQAKVGALKKLQEDSAAELNALMPSILSRAFAGEL